VAAENDMPTKKPPPPHVKEVCRETSFFALLPDDEKTDVGGRKMTPSVLPESNNGDENVKELIHDIFCQQMS
jgi:hypothetical protein